MKTLLTALLTLSLLLVSVNANAMLIFEKPDCSPVLELINTRTTGEALGRNFLAEMSHVIEDDPFWTLDYLVDEGIPKLWVYANMSGTNKLLEQYALRPTDPQAVNDTVRASVNTVRNTAMSYCLERAALVWTLETEKRFGGITLAHALARLCTSATKHKDPFVRESCALTADGKLMPEPH